MNYKQYGTTGTAIVFLLGTNTEPPWYWKFFTELGKAYTVYVIYYPGIGSKDKVNEHTLDNYMEYIHERIHSELKLKEYFLAGFSFGGYLTLEYQYRHRKSGILGLILLSPMLKISTKNVFSLGIRFIKEEFLRFAHRNRNYVYSIFYPQNLRYPITKIRHTKLVLAVPDITKERIVNDNYLVIVGEQDKVVDVKYTKEILDNKKIISNKELGHQGFALEAERSVRQISEFIESNSK